MALIMHHTTTQEAGFVYSLPKLHFWGSQRETDTPLSCKKFLKTAIFLGQVLLVNSTYNSECELCKILLTWLSKPFPFLAAISSWFWNLYSWEKPWGSNYTDIISKLQWSHCEKSHGLSHHTILPCSVITHSKTKCCSGTLGHGFPSILVTLGPKSKARCV